MNELTNKIMNTLKNSNLNNAILINGKWGSGKTYYVKNELIPKLEVKDKNEDYAVIYISLYGIKNLDDISKEMFNKIYFPRKILNKRKKRNFSRDYFKETAKGSLKGVIAGLITKHTGFDITLPNIENFWKYVQDKNAILILDDLERSTIELVELMGYINNFIEEYKIQTIIVSDEDEIKRKYFSENLIDKYNVVKDINLEQAQSQPENIDLKRDWKEKITQIFDDVTTYDIIKEKVIGFTFEFEPDLKEIFRKLKTKSFSNKDVDNAVLEYKRIGYKNIRTFKFSQYLIKLLMQEIKKFKISNKDEVMRLVKDSIIRLSIEIKDKTAYVDNYEDGFFNKEFINSLKGEARVRLEGVIGEFVTTSIIDYERLRKHILEVDEKITKSKNKELNINKELQTYWIELSDEELTKKMEQTINNISTYPIDITQYLNLIEHIHFYNMIFNNQENVISLDEVTGKMIKKIESHKSDLINYEMYFKNYGDTFNKETQESVQKYASKITAAVDKQNIEYNRVSDKDNNFETTSWIESLKNKNNNYKYYSRVENKSIIGIQNTEVLGSSILNSSKKELSEFMNFLKGEIYTMSNVKDNYSEDLENLEVIKTNLEKKLRSINEADQKLFQFLIKKVIDKVGNIIDKIKG